MEHEHAWGAMRWLGSLNGQDHSEDLGVDGRILEDWEGVLFGVHTNSKGVSSPHSMRTLFNII
jgi:hypothetical protein